MSYVFGDFRSGKGKWLVSWTGYESTIGMSRRDGHVLSVDKDGNMGCDCSSWKFAKSPKPDCKHIRAFKDDERNIKKLIEHIYTEEHHRAKGVHPEKTWAWVKSSLGMGEVDGSGVMPDPYPTEDDITPEKYKSGDFIETGAPEPVSKRLLREAVAPKKPEKPKDDFLSTLKNNARWAF